MVRITRINELNQIPVAEKYLIDIRDIQYWYSLSLNI
jgi:hypothetical protein